MAKKTSNTKQKSAKQKQLELEKQDIERRNKTIWIIIDIVAILLAVFTFTKMGIVGIVLNNICTFLFGTLYLIPLISVFIYGIYYVFFKDKYHFSIRFVIGIILLNIAILMLDSIVGGEIMTFKDLLGFITRIVHIADENAFVGNTGGVIGEFIYVSCVSLFTDFGAFLVMICLFIVCLILLIPQEYIKEIIESAKEKREIKKQERAKQKEIEAKRLEEERLKLAEKMNSEAEEIIEQEPIEEESFEIPTIEEKQEKKIDPSITANSKYFINLDEKEIKAKDNHAKTQEILTEKPKSSTSENKVVKVKKNNGAYKLPRPIERFLESVNNKSSNVNKSSAKLKGERVIEILDNFDIKASLLKTYIGPSVTKFEIKPDTSVKVNRIQNISDNLKMELAAKDIRIEAPIPGRNAVGIEIPNVEPIPVKMLDLMKNIPSDRTNEALLFALGKNLMGEGVYCNLAKMPHLLIAGATGSGKSVCINTIITSFLLRTHPDDVKLVLVDPKRVEFTPYHDIPHLLWPVITDATMASNMLKKLVVIMQERYEAFAEVGVRDITSFNNFVEKHNAHLTAEESPMQRLSYIVVIIDELADLMAIAKKDVELSIQRITQLARASGIHLIIATQRPSTDVITGLIKSNVPSRISFAVASSIDSRTILDSTGAERLLGNGDMLYYPQGETAPIRLQGVFVTDNEIKNITDYVKSQAAPEYEDSYFEFLTNMNGTTVAKANDADSNDSLYDEVVEFVKMKQAASTSLLQRRFGIGYNRAARLIDTLEDRGIIGPAQGSKPREVYIKNDEE